jgi:hypothetical protein
VAKWYVIDKGVKAGPFSDSDFFDYLKGKDPAAVQIWREGMSAWVPAVNIPQLVALMAPSPEAPRRPSFTARHAIAAILVSLIALTGIGAMFVVPHLQQTDRTAISEPAPQEKAPAAGVEPPRPAPPPPPSRLSREQFSDEVRKSMPLLDSLQQRFSTQYDDLVSEFYAKLAEGYPEAETAIAMRRKAFGIIKGLLLLADDDVLLELNKITGEKYRVLNSQNPSLCYAFGTGADSPDISAAFSDDLLRRESDLYERAIRTAASRPTPDPRKVSSLQGNLRRALLTSGVTESQFALLDTPHVAPEQHAPYCEVTILLFREIGRLAPEDAALVMRLLVSGK